MRESKLGQYMKLDGPDRKESGGSKVPEKSHKENIPNIEPARVKQIKKRAFGDAKKYVTYISQKSPDLLKLDSDGHMTINVATDRGQEIFFDAAKHLELNHSEDELYKEFLRVAVENRLSKVRHLL